MILNNEQETINFASEFSESLKGGEIICLNGNLGAGKTTFMKGVADFFDIDRSEVISPTFTIVNIYNCNKNNIKRIIHIDAYRIKNEDEILDFGILEFFNEKDTIVFIEWAENIKKYIKNEININIGILENNKRSLQIV